MSPAPARPTVLTVAGSDPSAGAGIQADLKTITALGGYAVTVVTALTAQSTTGVTGVHPVPAAFVRRQLDTLLEDIDVHAVKVGMLGSRAVAEELMGPLTTLAAHGVPIVIDPVMVSTSGARLIDDDAETALIALMAGCADLITPNLPEAQRIAAVCGASVSEGAEPLAAGLRGCGMPRVLVKGGHATGTDRAVDVLVDEQGSLPVAAPWIDTRSTHGTGCTLSSAIATMRAHGRTWRQAVQEAKSWTTEAIRHADRLPVGHGHGPLHHDWERDRS